MSDKPTRGRTCQCQVLLAGQVRCMHPNHEKYQQSLHHTDCEVCPLKIPLSGSGEPILPGAISKAKSLVKSVASAAMGGFKTVSNRAYAERLHVCTTCPLLVRDNTCADCGCGVKAKAAAAVWQCGLGYWDHIPTNIQRAEELPEAEHSPEDLEL